jgi:two-component system, NtrC family, sensor kinase
MFTYKPSIRQKIRLGYYAVVVMIVGLSIFTYFELNFIEKKIMFGEAISEFFDTTLEIRRFEKNYFLYEKRSDLDENLRYVTKAQELLATNSIAFAAVTSEGQVPALTADLVKYKDLMERYEKLNRQKTSQRAGESSSIAAIEKTIRKYGKDIITSAEDVAKTERRSLQATLSSSRQVLILSIALLVLMVLVIGQIMAQLIVKPLKLMERTMEKIADGRFENIRIDSRDREVLSLTNAFNKMLRELEMRQRHLVQSEKLASLGTLLSGVAHELNNPLSNISSSSQILSEEFDDGSVEFKKELIAQINDQTDRARNIVRSLLEFSRDKDFKKQTLSLNGLLEETIRFVKGQITGNVSVRVDVPADLTIIADKQRIQQVFLNLIKNAIEAVEGGGAVTVTAAKHSALDKAADDENSIYNYLKYRGKCTLEEDTVDIQIHDTGPGIPQELLSKIFDPFFTTKDVGKGSGLGLFIVHEIIEEHDGCIGVDSAPGKGTTFLIRLPMK